jgi:outer membrane protein assembly factor BamB
MEKKEKIRFLSRLALAVGVISFFVATLLLLNYINIQKTDPLESEAITALVERLKDEPNNDALKQEIRYLDLLARKAYFTSHWQVKTGGFILLFSSIALVILLKMLYDLRKTIELPGPDEKKGMADRILSQRWIGIIGFIIIGGALLVSLVSRDYLKEYDSASVSTVPAPADEGIEVIEIASSQDSSVAGSGTIVDETTQDSLEASPEEAESNEPVVAEAGQEGQAKSVQQSKFPGLEEIKKQHNAFRGPLSQGVCYHKNIPVSWDGATGENVLWKVEVPRQGNNSPVIWGEKVFLAGADQQIREVYCYNRNTGELLWKHEASGIEGSPATPPKTTSDTGLSAPTLTTDGQRVYAIFGTGDILALDMEGKRIWARNLGVPDNHYGHSSSLICWKEKLVVQYDTNSSGRLLALNVLDGSTIYDIPRNVQISWASPVLGMINGKYQILTTSAPDAIGHDLETGKELWSVECMMGEVGPSVAFIDGIVIPSNEYATMVAIDPSKEPVVIMWDQDNYLPEASSPVAINGLIFLGTSYGVFACFDAKTGEMKWEFEGNSGFYGSPIAVDGKIYVMDMSGTMYIFEISGEMKLVGEPSLGEKSVVTPTFMDGRIYLRGSKYLYCIGE